VKTARRLTANAVEGDRELPSPHRRMPSVHLHRDGRLARHHWRHLASRVLPPATQQTVWHAAPPSHPSQPASDQWVVRPGVGCPSGLSLMNDIVLPAEGVAT